MLILREKGVLGANIISTGLWRGVAPLMARATPLSRMGVGLFAPRHWGPPE
jgi:hypothetical protein